MQDADASATALSHPHTSAGTMNANSESYVE